MSFLTRLFECSFLGDGSFAVDIPFVSHFCFQRRSSRRIVLLVICCDFPRPSDRKSIKRHGWEKRMSTPEGRRVLIRRILKG
ncbi:PREDICTED: 39S ribosomal protein L34, mitochondrial-like [Nicrophorus vespilloides]|uniref:Large ribosomal subunit protein bL34m n=1 Tax=Nicrophorus vespilloides TaxID=110193 RepID=A0ABM1MN71_NICVS|nr:PREDICTED: 39S ribosomal protein L34, mitochondrial-like [Nicrophorus vespilloides]